MPINKIEPVPFAQQNLTPLRVQGELTNIRPIRSLVPGETPIKLNRGVTLFSSIKGLSQREADILAKQYGYVTRVIRSDNIDYRVASQSYRSNRISLTLINGKVSEIQIG